MRRWGGLSAFPLWRRCWWRRLLRLRLLVGIRAETAVATIAVFPIGTVRPLIALATAEAAFGLLAFATIAVRTTVFAVAVLTRPVPIVPIVAEVLSVAAIETLIVTIVTIVVVPLIAIMPRTVVVTVLMIEVARRLLLIRLLRRLALRLLRLDAELVALLVAKLVAVVSVGTGKRMRASCPIIAERVHAALLCHLLAIAQNNPIVVLSVLKIVLREHRITR